MSIFNEHLQNKADPTGAAIVGDSTIARIMAIDGQDGDFNDNTDSLEAIANAVAAADAVVDEIPSETNAKTFNATALASIEAEAVDALESLFLDELSAVADATLANVVDDSVVAHILSEDGDTSAYDDTTMSLESAQKKRALIQPDSAKNLSTIETELDAVIDIARAGDSASYLMDGSEITLYEETDTTAFLFAGGYIDWTGLNAAAGEDTTIKGYIKIVSGGSYVQIYEETFLAAALPSPLGVPFPRDVSTQCTPSSIYNTYGVKFTATQADVGGGWNTLPVEVYDAKAGG